MNARTQAAVAAVRGWFDRDTVVWAVVPSVAAALVTLLFVIPNYSRALGMQDEAQRLEAVASENISQRNNLKLLEANVAALRATCARRCRPLAEGAEHDRLLAAITRPTDGSVVREQSIRTGQMAPVDGVAIGGPVRRRDVTVEMTASFESIFGVLDAAEGIDQLVTPRSVEIVVLAGPIEQATEGNPAVRATMVFDEWFEAPAKDRPAQAADGARKGAAR
jgi:hypothetical protein